MTVSVLAGVLAVEDQDVSPGVLGFLVVALLGAATYLLIRSMNRQIGRIDLPDERDDPPDADDAADDPPRGQRPERPGPDGQGPSPR